MSESDHCKSCPFILRSMHACPRTQVLESEDLFAITLEILWVAGSFLPPFIFIITAISSISKKTSRGFSIFTLIFGQHIICEIIQRFYPEARPPGSCTTAAAFPSTHATFVGCLDTWLILEMMLLNSRVPFKRAQHYAAWRNAFLLFSIIVPFARYNLNYHTSEQIILGMFTGGISAMGYFMFLLITTVYQSYEGYRKSMFGRLWKQLNLRDNFTEFQQEEDRRARLQLKELQKKSVMMTDLKNKLKAQRDELERRVSYLQEKNK